MGTEIIKELFSDPDFAEKAFRMTPAELSATLKDNGVEVSAEEIKEAGEQIKKLISEDGELSEEALQAVSGGGFWGGLVAVLVSGGIPIAVLMAIAGVW